MVLVVILVVTISHISRDENVYSRCEKPLNIPWTHRRMSSDEMELVITVSDVDDNPPVFSRQMYTVAVVRGTPPPTTLINLAVSDINSSKTILGVSILLFIACFQSRIFLNIFCACLMVFVV